MLETHIEGMAKLEQAGIGLAAARDAVQGLLSKASTDFANRAVSTIKQDYLSGGVDRLKVRTGRLRSSVRFLVAETSSEINITFGSDVPYAAIHEFGGKTPAHDIRPKRKRMLRFISPGFTGEVRRTKTGKLARRQADGAISFARVVHHPGSKVPARPFLTPGVGDELPAFQESMSALLERAALKGIE
jgi:phage gpG-like protein